MQSTRLIRVPRALPNALRPLQSSTRPFSITAPAPGQSSRVDTSNLPDDEHATDKLKRRNDDLEPQTKNVKSGIESKQRGDGGTAANDRDTMGQVGQAKRENPEAPDPAIGMQDEKGH